MESRPHRLLRKVSSLETAMDTETKHSAYHSAPYHAAGTAIMSFKPINAIHQHLCAFHVYSCVFISLLLWLNAD